MRIEGKRIKRTRLVHKGRYVVAVEVEMVIPDDDELNEPCYESETLEFLLQVEAHAERGDGCWLHKVGKVYQLVDP